MPKLSAAVPKYRKHRASGQAVVTINDAGFAERCRLRRGQALCLVFAGTPLYVGPPTFRTCGTVAH